VRQRHGTRHLIGRGLLAAVSDVAMLSGVYPLVPHATLALSRWRKERAQPARQLRTAAREWAIAVAMSAARPTGFFGLPGADGHGPRPIVMVHGYAMNRANFLPLALRLARAGLGPIAGFEYWTLGKTASAAKALAAFVAQVRAATGAAQVDVVGHSMGGVVGRY